MIPSRTHQPRIIFLRECIEETHTIDPRIEVEWLN